MPKCANKLRGTYHSAQSTVPKHPTQAHNRYLFLSGIWFAIDMIPTVIHECGELLCLNENTPKNIPLETECLNEIKTFDVDQRNWNGAHTNTAAVAKKKCSHRNCYNGFDSGPWNDVFDPILKTISKKTICDI